MYTKTCSAAHHKNKLDLDTVQRKAYSCGGAASQTANYLSLYDTEPQLAHPLQRVHPLPRPMLLLFKKDMTTA